MRLASLRTVVSLAWLLCLPFAESRGIDAPLRVQLSWSHQAQFSGFYVAQQYGFFKDLGLSVVTLPGGPGINSLNALTSGQADLAVAPLSAILQNGISPSRFTNIGQIFRRSALILMCRQSAGISGLRDIAGKSVGIANAGEESIIRLMIASAGSPEQSTTFVQRDANDDVLVSGGVDCATAMTYNEYWRVVSRGVQVSDLIIFRPEDAGVVDLQDGLYVLTDRLSSPAFRKQLTQLVVGLRRGWRTVHENPTMAVTLTLGLDASLERFQQRQMLESVLQLVEPEKVGYLDLNELEKAERQALAGAGTTAAEYRIWTHGVWNEVQKAEGKAPLITEATRHAVDGVLNSTPFNLFVLFGVGVFALGGLLESIQLGHSLWGRHIISLISCLGGGMIRDLLIGAERLPFYFTRDLTQPAAILAIVLLGSLFFRVYPDSKGTPGFIKTKRYADFFGFSAIALKGAMVAVAANMPWPLIPVCSAITCVGGGILRDVLLNREPRSFRGTIYEEVAMVSAFILLGGLLVANRFEHEPAVAHAALAASLLASLGLRFLVEYRQIRWK